MNNDRVTLRFLAGLADVTVSGNAVPAGVVLEWIDKAAYAFAAGWSASNCVTAYVGDVNFTHPIRPGELVEVNARVVLTGTTSIHVLVRVESTDVRHREFSQAPELRAGDGSRRRFWCADAGTGVGSLVGRRQDASGSSRSANRAAPQHPGADVAAAIHRQRACRANRASVSRRTRRRDLGRQDARVKGHALDRRSSIGVRGYPWQPYARLGIHRSLM